MYSEERDTKISDIDSPLEYNTISLTDEINDYKQNDVIEYSEDCVFKDSPINEKDEFDPQYNNCDIDNEDISLPPVNMIMDVIDHMLAEVSATSSSSSSISEPGVEPLEIVPESPKLMTSSPYVMDNSGSLSTSNEVTFSKDEKTNNVELSMDNNSKDKKMPSLMLVCNRIIKKAEPGSDLSTPSPLEEISRPQLRVEQTESPNITTTKSTVTPGLSTMSLLSSVMAKHANKDLTFESSATDTDADTSKTNGKERLLNVCASSSNTTTVNAAADFFNALLKSDKTLTSASNQGNAKIGSI